MVKPKVLTYYAADLAANLCCLPPMVDVIVGEVTKVVRVAVDTDDNDELVSSAAVLVLRSSAVRVAQVTAPP